MMEQHELETVVKNIDQRVGRIEQILPTLATKEDVRVAIAPLATRAELQNAIAPLATRAEMHEAIQKAIQKAVEPLATRAEMHEALREEGERTRRHFDIVAEDLRSHIRLIAEGQIGLQQRMDDLRTELKADIAQLDRRVMRLEATR